MKRAIAILGMIFSFLLIHNSVNDLNDSVTWLNAFIAIFFLIVGAIAFASFLDDFKNNEWPF